MKHIVQCALSIPSSHWLKLSAWNVVCAMDKEQNYFFVFFLYFPVSLPRKPEINILAYNRISIHSLFLYLFLGSLLQLHQNWMYIPNDEIDRQSIWFWLHYYWSSLCIHIGMHFILIAKVGAFELYIQCENFDLLEFFLKCFFFIFELFWKNLCVFVEKTQKNSRRM